MRKSLKRLLILLGILWMYGLAHLLVWTFLIAYSNPAKKVLIDINVFNEAFPEYIMFMVVVSIMTISLHYFLEGIKNDDQP